MEEYVELMILAYFKQYGPNYSVFDLKNKIGISLVLINDIIDRMIEKEMLRVHNSLIEITQYGRIYLSRSDLESYSFWNDDYKINSSIKQLPMQQIFPVKEFSKKKWRGGNK